MFILETKGGYAGILALINFLSFESIDVKLKLAKKLLAATFINLNAPFIIAKQVKFSFAHKNHCFYNI